MLPNQLAIGIEADPMAIKQFVDVGGQQQSIGTIKALLIGTVPPGLDMASNQEFLPG